jgi:membrane protease YdiL (CAAX protease family)
LLLSNVAFVVYHYGVQPFTLTNILCLSLDGMIFGYVYYLSGSIVLVVLLHSIYDAIWSFSPFMVQPLPEPVAPVILLATLVGLVVANRRPRTAPGGETAGRADTV